jgi:K+-sensing histidine kinase KdpD
LKSFKSSSKVSIQNSYQYLLFEIEDTGIGISDEKMASLFNPFQQAQKLAGGTGLGLFSLSKRLDALHGYYGVRRRTDGVQGSVFWFAIPYKPDMTAERAVVSTDIIRPRITCLSNITQIESSEENVSSLSFEYMAA